MEMKILYSGAMLFGGWLWSYLFVRQFLFNVLTAYPLIKQMLALKDELIAVGAKRYTTTSMVVCILVSAIVIAIVAGLCPVYLIISFFVGALVAFAMLFKRMSYKNRAMFDTFCSSYHRFVPDDELRTAMYNKKTGQIKSRLKAMELTGSFVPDFKE